MSKPEPFWHVVTDRLFYGPYIWPEKAAELVAAGVTDVLNLDLPYLDLVDMEATGVRVHWHLLYDMAQMTIEQAVEVTERIDVVLADPSRKIYVHCNWGVSRSPTVAWLYLLRTGASPEAASARVQPDGRLFDRATVDRLRELGSRGG